MQIEFEFEMNDWMAFQKHYLVNSKVYKQSKLIVTLLMPATFLVLILINLEKKGTNELIILSVMGSIFSLIWILFYPKFQLKKTLQKMQKMIDEGNNKAILGKHGIELNDEGIIHTEPHAVNKINWNGIVKIDETLDYYFLYNTAISAIIIPKLKVQDQLLKLDEVLKSHIKVDNHDPSNF